MSYLTQYAVSRPSGRKGARVDEHTILNLPAFDGGAHVRAFVEDTSNRKLRRRRIPSPRLKLRITDCTNRIHLEFSVDSPELRENSLHKINTLIAALDRFRAGLTAEAALRELRENPRKEVLDVVPEASPYAATAAVRSNPRLGPGPEQRRGFAWSVDDWTRLRRFLILGSEGGSYYASELELTRKNATAVERCLAEDGPRAVREIVRVSDEGRAPKNDPAIFALAIAAGVGDEETRRSALEALSQVCRTGTHLFQFATFVEGFRGWGRSLRRAVGNWYAGRSADSIAYQAVKYRQRDGVTHRDLLRLAHPGEHVTSGNPTVDVSGEHARLFEWIVRGGDTRDVPRVVEGFARAQAAGKPTESAALVREYGLPREAVRTEHLASAEVWEALLEDMPMTAMIRNLATMTRVGVLESRSTGTAKVVERLGDADRIRRARVHPIAVLAALRTYAAGRGARGRGAWRPVRKIVDALDAAFYAAFGNVEPAGTRLLLALDVSGSMECGEVAGVPGLSPREASAALALVTAATEPDYEVVGFFAGKGGWKSRTKKLWDFRDQGLTPLAISPRQRLDDVVKTISDLPFGGTDCALPMLYAQAQNLEVDTFAIFTDSETWAGGIHPAQALQDYRQASGIDACLVVCGMVANQFSIADPADPGMLDVVGFDTATPQLISDFARGAL